MHKYYPYYFRLGEMDSLHVSSAVNQQQQSGSKTSSRSTSPCRPRDLHPIGGAVASSTPTTAAAAATTSTVPSHRPHHTKTLSHGSVESAKVSFRRILFERHIPRRSVCRTRPGGRVNTREIHFIVRHYRHDFLIYQFALPCPPLTVMFVSHIVFLGTSVC